MPPLIIDSLLHSVDDKLGPVSTALFVLYCLIYIKIAMTFTIFCEYFTNKLLQSNNPPKLVNESVLKFQKLSFKVFLI